jgi:hypothetical protein
MTELVRGWGIVGAIGSVASIVSLIAAMPSNNRGWHLAWGVVLLVSSGVYAASVARHAKKVRDLSARVAKADSIGAAAKTLLSRLDDLRSTGARQGFLDSSRLFFEKFKSKYPDTYASAVQVADEALKSFSARKEVRDYDSEEMLRQACWRTAELLRSTLVLESKIDGA